MRSDDPLVAEIRLARDQHAARFGYDLKGIFADIQARQKTSGRNYVRFAPRRVAPVTFGDSIYST